MISRQSIKAFSRRLVAEYQPERVVLFGSYAEGRQTSDSDVDLLVVMPFEGKPVNKSVEIRLKLRPPFPVDLIVRTPEVVRQRLQMGDDFLRGILEKGKTLYEADHV